MRIGVHVSVRRGMIPALEAAKRLGCETLQIFTRAPHDWRTNRVSEEEGAAFDARRRAMGLEPLVVHTPYLPNLSTRHETIYRRSLSALRDDLVICRNLRADYFIIHPGSYSDGATPEDGITRMAAALRETIDLGEKTRILIENMAGGSRRLGSTWEELRAMLDAVHDDARTGICLDTAHTLGAGYAFSTAEEVQETLASFDRVIGLERLFVIHANGSAAPRGSHRDWHTHLDEGFIGADAFQALLQHPKLQRCAVILETPHDTPEANPRNLARLREWSIA
jgi:deoxyribonuclease-4